MITWRDEIALTLGAAAAAFALTLLEPFGVAGGFLAGSIVATLAAWRTIRRLVGNTVTLQEERDAYGLELLGAWGESDRLRADVGLGPLPRPPLADLRRTVRSQEDTCSSAPSSAA